MRPTIRKPAYVLHRPTGQARVRIDRKDFYLGKYGTAESRARYDDLIAEWFSQQGDVGRCRLTVADLALLYLEHAKEHYQKGGQQTSEVTATRLALRPLVKLFAETPARNFGPRALKDVRDAMIRAGTVRSSINHHIGRIRRAFKWAVAEELLPPMCLLGLQAVHGLQAGRTKARESVPVRPVARHLIDALQPHVSRPVWAMIQVQLLTGMRPGEVVLLRGCDLNMAGRVWEYRPSTHKTEHHGKTRAIYIGPRAQAIIQPFLRVDLQAYLFDPREGRATYLDQFDRHTAGRPRGKRQARERYTANTYGRAIRNGCERAFGMPEELRRIPSRPTDAIPASEIARRKLEAAAWRAANVWSPNQLRHNAATDLRRQFGIELARVILGHSSAVTTEIYAEADLARAREIAAQIG